MTGVSDARRTGATVTVRARALTSGALMLLALAPLPALAQEEEENEEENATTQASDAFGKTVGNDSAGLYSANHVRGFNPVDAGNVRVAGLYLDLAGRMPLRLLNGNTIRVGLASIYYPFPAPTGLVDYELDLPRDESGLRLRLENAGNAVNGVGGSAEFDLPISEDFALSGGMAGRRAHRPEGGTHAFFNSGFIARLGDPDGPHGYLFTGKVIERSNEARATYFPSGDAPPPKVRREEFLGQPWTAGSSDSDIYGGFGTLPLGEWQIDAGLFLSEKSDKKSYSDLLLGVDEDGVASERVIVAGADDSDRSISGEARLSRTFKTGSAEHRIVASVRGRKRDRRFDGRVRISLGESDALSSDFRDAPEIVYGPKSTDAVQQYFAGLAYNLQWDETLGLGLGLSQSDYRKHVDFADPALSDPTTRDKSLLWNAAASLKLTGWATLYAGAASGIEEAAIAPDRAANRAEAPPAIETRQIDTSLRLAITDSLRLLVGAFRITKPYYNLDSSLRYRQLGELSNRGLEFSLAGTLRPGLSIIAGTALFDPVIDGEAVDSGTIGKRPVGQINRRSTLNIDWRTQAGAGPLSFDLALESLSGSYANSRNSFSSPAYATLDVGARYRFDLGRTSMILRPEVSNLLNAYGWDVSPSGGFTFHKPRTLRLELTASL